MVIKISGAVQPRNGKQWVSKNDISVMYVFLKLTEIQPVTAW